MIDSTGHIIVGLSGGVDSAVAAHLLLERGYSVAGLFMKNWEEDDTQGHCTAARDLADAEAVCRHLGIALHTVNFASEYWDRVFTRFLEEYRAGRTPNPDVLCNREIKFRAFLEHAKGLGADKIATGHYARLEPERGGWRLVQGRDRYKDQSYFLYRLDQNQLASALFPLGDYTKDEVRTIARRIGLANHDKKDSTGLCFIGERRFDTFLARFLPEQPGDIVTTDGRILGRHRGLMFYTHGQRSGLGLGGQAGLAGAPWYVVDKDIADNRLIVAQDHDHPLLLSRELVASDPHWISGRAPSPSAHLTARIRYRQAVQSCRLHRLPNHRLHIEFTEPQRAAAPGQALVLYQTETCLGGGTIEPLRAGARP